MRKCILELDYCELVNLHKALLEAKFHTAPDNPSVSGSPIIANLYIQIRDWLIESEKGEEWNAWFHLSNQPDRRNQAVFLMGSCKQWGKADPDKKRKIAHNYLAPFLFGEEELMDVIEEVDRLSLIHI